MRKFLFAGIVSLVAFGCGGSFEERSPIKLEDVPAPAMKTAREKAPSVVNFTEAYLKKDGTYEVKGKTKNGKTIEVEVKGDGTFVALE